jgi:O-antigen/teichoic acid export membrane protein
LAWDVMPDTRRGDAFSGGVAVLFGTYVFGAGIGIINGILLARLLGPAGKGDYYILVLVPATAMVLLQLGLPQAFNFYAARGQTIGIGTKALVLTAGLTMAAILGFTFLLPLLREAMLHDIPLEQVAFACLVFPLALYASFTTGIVMGRRAVRWYAGVKIAYPIAWTVLLVVVLGGLGPSVGGAIAVFLIGNAIQAVGFALGAARVTRTVTHADLVTYRDLVGYGLRFYPASLSGFFEYRADAFLIAFLIADASAELGYYSMAVGLAEMIFFLPRAVSSLFFPHVAGTSREDSDRQVALVARVTLLVSAVGAALLVPAAALMISIVLPAFSPSMVPLLVLLPGVVALSGANVVGSYLRGIGRPGVPSVVSLVALAANIVANLILIPLFGIVGAAAASFASYTFSSFALSVIAAHFTGTSVTAFWIPRPSDVGLVVSTLVSLVRRTWSRSRELPGDLRL